MQKYEIYYQVAHSQLQEQHQRNRALDTKAARTLGLAAALGGVGSVVLKDFTGTALPGMSTWTLVAAVLLILSFAATCAFALYAMKPRDWRGDPDLGSFASHLPNYKDHLLVEWAGDQIKNAVIANEGALGDKSQSVERALLTLTALVAALLLISLTAYI